MLKALRKAVPGLLLLLVMLPGAATAADPVILGDPPTTIREGEAYSYTLQAYDPDGDPLTWSFHSSSEALRFDPETLTIHGQPGAGRYAVNLTATDPSGGRAELRYVLVVEEAPPGALEVFLQPTNILLSVLLGGTVAGALRLRRRPTAGPSPGASAGEATGEVAEGAAGPIVAIGQPTLEPTPGPLEGPPTPHLPPVTFGATTGGGPAAGVEAAEETGVETGPAAEAAAMSAPEPSEGEELILGVMVLNRKAALVDEYSSDQEEVTLGYRDVLRLLQGKGLINTSRLEAPPYILHFLHVDDLHLIFFTKSPDDERVLREARDLVDGIVAELRASRPEGGPPAG